MAVTGGPALDLDTVIGDPLTRIVVCCGSGGVGKTTTAAALAIRAAEQGRTVVVLTIDPARRLAQSMGIETLDNTPRPVAGVRKPPGAERAGGVSTTMRSHRPVRWASRRSWLSFSIAMYSWVPANELDRAT